jgi:hypothetical protein
MRPSGGESSHRYTRALAPKVRMKSVMAAFDAGVVEGDVDVPGQGRVPIDTIGMSGLVVAVPAVHVDLRRRGRQPGGDLRIRRANGTGMVCR